MSFLSLFLVASLPIVQVLLIGLLGAFLATGFCNILTPSAQKDINKVVYAVFTPALIFSNLAKTVTLEDVISWWFMPVNIGIIFLIGGLIGWLTVLVLNPPIHLRGLIIASCSTGNLGYLLMILVPAVCDEDGNPFGSDKSICRSKGLSYVSFSMGIGGIYIWTYTYSLMKRTAKLIKNAATIEQRHSFSSERNDLEDIDHESVLSKPEMDEKVPHHLESPLILSNGLQSGSKRSIWTRLKNGSHKVIEELLAPPTLSAIVGFVIGAIPWLKSLIIGDNAPLRVVQDSISLLEDATVPCITLILGGNLTQGLKKSVINPTAVISIIIVRYVILPIIGIGVVKLADQLGFLPQDPLYQYVLMIQFALPPAMNIGTMAQLFDIAQEECSVIFLWTYLVAAIALTFWSTIFMWILS